MEGENFAHWVLVATLRVVAGLQNSQLLLSQMGAMCPQKASCDMGTNEEQHSQLREISGGM